MLMFMLIELWMFYTFVQPVEADDRCVDFNAGVYTGNTTTTETGFLFCVLTLPCQGISVTEVKVIEIYRASHEILASLDANQSKTFEATGLKVHTPIVRIGNEGVSYMSVEFGLQEMKRDYNFRCVVRLVSSNGSHVSLNVSSTLHVMKRFHQLKSLQSSVKDLLFHEEPLTFQQHRYHLGHMNSVKSMEAANFCAILGGYLAEINSADELGSIEKYLTPYNLTQPILIGGTYAEKGSKWIFQRGGKDVEILKWLDGEPRKDVIEKCLSLMTIKNEVFMKVTSCVGRRHRQKYLCEVE
ncbi:perlucin-like protein [Biomphalaria pfeifferi]|uniref:Perlucin-like protein n=1 Tax=Biomphalaria pfeifferi TaxID=112525 RepID=A0AAD8C6P7_BIOPF|nr:perlucin-like protein [Biomphalaria pfeifferi]